MKLMDFQDIINIIAEAAKKQETVEIYYPKTDNNPAGWREVEPYSLTTDTGEEGETLVYGEDRLSPGHIFNGYNVTGFDNYCHSFIIGKIKQARKTGKKFTPRNNWNVMF